VDQISYPAAPVVERESSRLLEPAPAPEQACYRIVGLQVEIGSWYEYKTFGTNQLFVPKQLAAATIAYPGEKETYNIIPKVVEITHAANRIIIAKINKPV
jgi:hypothetical protein